MSRRILFPHKEQGQESNEYHEIQTKFKSIEISFETKYPIKQGNIQRVKTTDFYPNSTPVKKDSHLNKQFVHCPIGSHQKSRHAAEESFW